MSKFSCFFLFGGNPTNKTVTGTAAHTWGTTNSKPSRPIIMIDQSELLSRSHVQFITLFFGGVQLCCAFYPATAHCTNLVQKTQSTELKTSTFWLFHTTFYCRFLPLLICSWRHLCVHNQQFKNFFFIISRGNDFSGSTIIEASRWHNQWPSLTTKVVWKHKGCEMNLYCILKWWMIMWKIAW